MAKLVVLTEGMSGRTYELKVDKTTVGRLEDNAFQLADQSVSSHHCEIILRGNDVVVKDLNSTNGSFINGEKVSEATLKHGQILRLGSIELKLEGDPGPAGKKQLDSTRVISGVKTSDLEQGTRPVAFGKDSPFAKKSNKTAMIFIAIGIALAALIVVLIFIALQKLRSESRFDLPAGARQAAAFDYGRGFAGLS